MLGQFLVCRQLAIDSWLLVDLDGGGYCVVVAHGGMEEKKKESGNAS